MPGAGFARRAPRLRRGALSLLAAAAALPAAAQGQGPPPAPVAAGAAAAAPAAGAPRVLIVNQGAVIENSVAARNLRETEREVRARVQSGIDRVKAELEAEERALVKLRDSLDPAVFDERTRDFDRRVRAERRRAQERGALLLRFVQDARAALLSALPRVLERLRADAGAAAILDGGAVLAADPALDVTAEAIARYDADMGEVRFDPPAELLAD